MCVNEQTRNLEMCITIDIFDAFYFCFNAKKTILPKQYRSLLVFIFTYQKLMVRACC